MFANLLSPLSLSWGQKISTLIVCWEVLSVYSKPPREQDASRRNMLWEKNKCKSFVKLQFCREKVRETERTRLAALSAGAEGIFMIHFWFWSNTLKCCFYTLVGMVHYARDCDGSLGSHHILITVSAAHLSCHWIRGNQIESVFGQGGPKSCFTFYTPKL